ncbi:LLM class flavin-dependent oxidoreductase [Actinotalea sp. Marseille-Q4924]|uniref:LLM class flavin-dependent oxidoreductase n=1 Tax=Actinotalea sp. Marseille-Q4924 TaxID=2866571 RepID=UPI001CE4519A|nr:LLM class flavin-dependent oxidoreductase [Actinotalea sp. Marseille-Q4924]
MTSHPMSVGALLPRDLPARDLPAFVRDTEALGFDELWVVEDCFFRGGIAQAAVALATTSTLRVGVGILPAAARNVAFEALELGTLAELYPGRLVAGVGHGMPGWMRQVGAWPASALTLLEEHLTALRSLLHGEEVTTHGRYVRLDAVRLESPPAVPPPVLAGVRGPRSLAVAGQRADGVVLAEPGTPAYVRAAREQAGGGAGLRVVAYEVAAVDDDAAVARDRARVALRWVGEADAAAHLVGLPFAEELTELCARHADVAAFAAALPDAWVDELAVVGTPEDARRRLGDLSSAGADAVVLLPAGPDPLAALHSLARVLPA